MRPRSSVELATLGCAHSTLRRGLKKPAAHICKTCVVVGAVTGIVAVEGGVLAAFALVCKAVRLMSAGGDDGISQEVERVAVEEDRGAS